MSSVVKSIQGQIIISKQKIYMYVITNQLNMDAYLHNITDRINRFIGNRIGGRKQTKSKARKSKARKSRSKKHSRSRRH